MTDLTRADERHPQTASAPIVYWHCELPLLDAELMPEHTVEATSRRVAGTINHRDELWDGCYQEFMAIAQARLEQEVARLGGHFAHIHDQSIDIRRDDATGEAWLHGCFFYALPPGVSGPLDEDLPW